MIKLQPVLKDYLWGGEKLKTLFGREKDGIIAESWELSVHKDGESTISGTDKTFAEYLKENKNAVDVNGGEFPVLIKYIDAAKKLRDAAAERGENKEIIAFLHFPAIFKGYMCDEIIMELYRGGIGRCYYGHIHGNYEAPAKISYADIDFYLVSADYLLFDPLAIQKNVDIVSK